VISLAHNCMFLIDYVLESNTEDFIMTVYYSDRRGGRKFQQAAHYMHSVQAVCNKFMSFYPTCLAMCIYGADVPKIYTYRVNTLPDFVV